MVLKTLTRIASQVALVRDVRRLRRAGDEHARQAARRHIAQRLGRLRGLPQKLGQMLSFTDASSANDAENDFAELQQVAEPMPLEAILPLLEKAWGRPVESVLERIEPRGLAASLGQVHQGRLHDGREVAIKVQYPGIRQAVNTDLKTLGWLSVPVGNLRRGFDLKAYRRVISEDLDRELDYCCEAQHQQAFSRWADIEPRLAVPEVIEPLSTETVLVSRWEDGESWPDVRDGWPEADRRRMARCLLDLLLGGLFSRGMMHADLHPGNVRFRRTGDRVQLLLYDFGCVFYPTDAQRDALLRLIRATMRGDESPWPLLIKLGFDPEFLEPLAPKLPALCRVLFEPFTAEYPYPMEDWRLAERVGDVLGDDRWNFRIAGPPALVFLLRAWHGLKHYLDGLAAPVPWQRVIEPILAARAADLDRLQLPEDEAGREDFTSLARHLKIRVREKGRTKVELTCKASGIDYLDGMLSEDIRRRIDARGLDLPRIIAGVRARGYAPGDVFELDEGEKNVRVWLE